MSLLVLGTGVSHPVTNYRPAFDDGHDLVRWGGVTERVADRSGLDVTPQDSYLSGETDIAR